MDGFPEVKVVLRADVSAAKYDKVAVISGKSFVTDYYVVGVEF